MKRKFTILTAAFVLLAFLALPMGMRGQTRGSYSKTYDVAALDTMFVDGSSYASANGYWKVPATAGEIATISIPITYQPESNISVSFHIATFGNGTNPDSSNTTITAVGTESNSNWSGSGVSSYPSSSSYVDGVMTINMPENPTILEGLEVTMGVNTGVKILRLQSITVSYIYAGGGYTVTYNANVTGVAPIVDTYTEGANVTLRDANTFTNEGYTFSEWNTQADGDGDPYDAGDVIENIQDDIELYAIWIENTPSDEQWVLTNLADLTENDVFVMVGNDSYAMSNDNGASSAPVPVSVTISGNNLTGNIAANIQWNITGNVTDGYSFLPNGTTDYLFCNTNAGSSSNNNLRIGNGGNYNRILFVLNNNSHLVTNDEYTARYVSIYNTQDWRGYTNESSAATMTFYKKVTGGVIPPSISADNVSIEYNAISGSIAYTINNGVDGGILTAATESGWLTLGPVGTTVPFTCTANEAGTERTATVTLTYTYDRATVTKDVTVTQAGNPNATMTIAEVRAQGTGLVATKGTVTSIIGSTNKTAYIQDATAAIVVFGNFAATIGDEIRVSGTLSDYNGLLEITNPQVTVISSGNIIDPELMTIAEVLASTNQGWYIRIEGATVTNISGSGNSQNTTIAQGDNTVVVRGNLGTTVAVNDIISLNGNIGNYNGVQIANPQNVEVQQNTEPAILLDTYEIEMPAEGGEGDINVTYQNLDVNDEDYYVCVGFYDESGVYFTYEWITVELDSNYNVHYVVAPNQGAARTAYFKVEYAISTSGDPGDLKGYFTSVVAASDLVTVSQEAYVAPTFAELPFEFNGGRADIESTDGLTQEGLGTDYNANTNPTTKLKFDGTGDWLLLHFNEAPGTLIFDIKGNSFSGGTFAVQTSEDGETYEDLAVYTELGDVDTKTFDNLDENVRYIKWIYTEKSSGNVGLGNIHLYELGGGPAPVASIIVTPDVVNVDAALHTEELPIAYENIVVENYQSFGVQFYDAEGEEIEMPNWLVVMVTGMNGEYNVTCAIIANEGEARSAYLKAYAYDVENNQVYSNLVTINQAAYIPPFEPATYTLATTIESGKTYIIVGSKTVADSTSYFAMGEQRNNNRGGVAISVDGITATVETADVHEFVITALEVPGFYSIYDNGYLYAASNSGNQLKTMDTLNENGQWEISINDTTGWFNVVASNSSNRNVMQFNYNGGNPIFSCYASASQSPVYLYVKDETPATLTQTLALTGGTNWVSFNVEITLNDLKAALVEAVPGTEIVIKSKDQNATYKPNTGRWTGRLTSLDLAQMYRINVAEDCEITLEGDPVDPTEHPFTVVPGTNWIGFPLSESMSLTNAFAGFAVNDDVLKSKDYTSQYKRGRWMGNQLTTLEPGQGYKYNSAATENRTLVFPAPAKNKK